MRKELALLAAAATTLFTAPAEAGATPAPKETVRYAWVKSCVKDKDNDFPCGPWMLTTSTGREVKLTDAQVLPKLASGTVVRDAVTQFQVSGDGRLVNYFRKSDGKLVIRDIASGSVSPLPGGAASLPRGLGMNDLDMHFSPNGRYLAIDYFDEKATQPTLIVDLLRRTTVKLPPDVTVHGFSQNGARLLVSRGTDDNTTEFVVYSSNGTEYESRVVPQVVTNNSPIALANDGVTVALVITGPRAGMKPKMRVYNMATDEISPALTIELHKSETPKLVTWGSGETLTMWTTTSNSQEEITAASRRTLHADSGVTERRDSFRIPRKLWTWWLPGE
ncbi:hypothetical protein [Sinosporangium siamense]|uniref:Uncharacterized protein n=1 Tax=Sinosporangium siamense TaxID=1367973 RepID=A0A919RK39_9ACTN|nr:hypothetical protein [Sinosporangium siamense]GII93491.1 hypothetical protein Ssi02_37220 [Sinosporangium siamense]